MLQICQYCEKEFDAYPANVRAGKAKFCSKACYDIAQTTGRVTQACEYCGTAFEVNTCEVARGGGRYCSRACVRHAKKDAEPARFWEQVQICAHGKSCAQCCWLWLGATTLGYGTFNVRINGKGHMVRSHVYAWETVNGPMPEGKQGNHIRECTSRACVNPSHIYAGTHKENTQDAMVLGSMKEMLTPERTQGEKNVKAKLTEQDVQHIRESTLTQKELAQMYGVHISSIKNIQRGVTWLHLGTDSLIKRKPGRPKKSS